MSGHGEAAIQQRQREDRVRGVLNQVHQATHVAGRHGDARQTDGERVPPEDLGKGLTHTRVDAPSIQGLGRMLARRAGAKVVIGEDDPCLLIHRIREWVVRPRRPVILKDVIPETVEGDGLEKPGRDNPVGVDVVAAQR